MKVVLWGCDNSIHMLYRMLLQQKTAYEVIAFGDIRCSLLNKNINKDDIIFHYGKILGFYDVKKLYEAKKIDGVIIGISDKNQYNFVQSQFEVMGIPIYKIINNISAFDIAQSTYKIFSDKLNVAVLADVDIEINIDKEVSFNYSYVIKNNLVVWESDRFFTHSQFHFSFPIIYPIKEYDLMLDKVCSLLFLGTDRIYGHFIFACLNQIYVMEESGFDGKYLLYDSGFSRKWMQVIKKALNVDENRIVYIEPHLFPRIHVKELHMVQNIIDAGKLNAEILYEFSRKVLNYIVSENKYPHIKFPEFLYVKRSENYARKLLPETENIITSYNFETIVPEHMPIDLQIEYFSRAKVIIALHGSNVANMIFMQKNSHLIELFDFSFVDLFYIECVNKIGVNFNMLVSHNEFNELTKNGCFIHPTLLKNTIEKIMNESHL